MDDFDKLIARVAKMHGTARIGAHDEKSAQKLAYAEFGTRTAPARPVLSETFDKSKSALQRVIDRHVGGVLDGKNETGQEIVQGVGEDLLELVKDEMQEGFGRPLKPSTTKGRRARGNTDSTQLIDRSLLEDGEVALVDALSVESDPGTRESPEE